MMFRYSGPVFALVMFTAVMMAVIGGASSGFEADSVQDARFTPDEYESTGDDVEGKQWAQDFADYLVEVLMNIASWVAVIVYHNRGWMDPGWTNAVLEAISYLGVGGVLLWQGMHIKSLLSGVMSS